MIVMPSNATGSLMRALAADFPGRVGNLVSPGGWRSTILDQYALDNGAYGAYLAAERARKAGTTPEPWSEAAYLTLLQRAAKHHVAPRWIAVPDVVLDWAATKEQWQAWAPRLRREHNWPLALVVQDGATPENVRSLHPPDVIFIGGSTPWKYEHLFKWTLTFPRVHVGRVNSYPSLAWCDIAGAESADGTGLQRTSRQRAGARRYLTEATA